MEKMFGDRCLFYVFHVDKNVYLYGVTKDLDAELEKCSAHFVGYDVTIKILAATLHPSFTTIFYAIFRHIVALSGDNVLASKNDSVFKTNNIDRYYKVITELKRLFGSDFDLEQFNSACTDLTFRASYISEVASRITTKVG